MTLAQAIPGTTPAQWATQVLQGLGAPANATNVDTLTRWANAESGGYNPNSAGGKYNPLNIIVTPGDGHSGQGGSQGDIADFPDLQTGVNATVRFFSPKGGNKQAIVDALKASNQAATVAAIQAFYGSWGSGFNLGGAPSETTAGGSSGPGATLASATANSDSDCLVKLPGTSVGPITLGGNCLVTRSAGRALLGAAALTAGALIMLAGLALMGAGSRPAQMVLSAVPLPGR